MTKRILKTERRQYPRLEKRLPVRVAANGYDFLTNTENISCAGAYCHVAKYIPPFTKVTVRLQLPLAADEKKDYNIECKGVVVRSQDEERGGFNIAIFFNEINETQRNRVSQYINQVSLPRPLSL